MGSKNVQNNDFNEAESDRKALDVFVIYIQICLKFINCLRR